jgi:hypothetical protein
VPPLLGCLALLAILAAAILLTAGAIALLRRDRHRGSGALGNAMQELESLFVESKRHVIEAEQREEAEESPSGDPPEKG